MTVRDVCQWVDALAPASLAEPWDNVGLQVGHPDRPVRTVLVALDVTPGVIAEAVTLGAELLVTHHPLLFAPRRDLCEMDREGALLGAMIRANLSLIVAHTNWDKAAGGVCDALLERLGLGAALPREPALTRTVTVESPLSLEALAQRSESALGDVVRRFAAPQGRPIRRLTVCGGAGSDFWQQALAEEADCFLTGECKHHHALEAIQAGIHVLAAGHHATELPGVLALCRGLQNAANAVQCSVHIIASNCPLFV